MSITANEEKLNRLFEELVPARGKADSLAGEIVRATSRIGYRFFNDGDQIGVGYGKETCNAAARFLMEKTDDTIASLVQGLWEIRDEAAYEQVLDILVGQIVKYVNDHPELRKQETDDMFDYYDKDEDRDDSEDEEE